MGLPAPGIVERYKLTDSQLSTRHIMNRARHTLLILASIACLAPSLFGQRINVTDTQGRAITATLVSSDGTTLKFVRESDSREFTLPLATLNNATRGAVKRWMGEGGNLTEIFEVTVDTGKTRKLAGDEDFDDKRVNLSPTVTVKNADSTNQSKPLQLTILFLGRPVESTTDTYVFGKQSFTLPKIEPIGSKEFEVTPMSEPYDSRGQAKFGSRYSGYVWLIHEEDGSRIAASGSVPTSMAGKHAEKFLELSAKGTYDRDLEPVSR